MRPWKCSQTDRYTDWQTDRQTDGSRFYNLSDAICYSYGTDNDDDEEACVACSNYEDVDTQFDRSISPDVLVYSNGICQWVPPGRFSTPCPIDISWFPFDDQTCSLTFQSWLYTGLKLNLTFAYDKIDKDFMNGEWNLLGKQRWFSRLSAADDN